MPETSTEAPIFTERLTRSFAPDVLTAAYHLVEKANTFASSLEAALMFAGPANYCPVLVGSIGGARWGFECIPAKNDDATNQPSKGRRCVNVAKER